MTEMIYIAGITGFLLGFGTSLIVDLPAKLWLALFAWRLDHD